jgi:hypothetical protein
VDTRKVNTVTPSKVTDRCHRIGGAHVGAETVERQPVLGNPTASETVQNECDVPLICPPSRAFKVADIHPTTTVHHHDCRPWP